MHRRFHVTLALSLPLSLTLSLTLHKPDEIFYQTWCATLFMNLVLIFFRNNTQFRMADWYKKRTTCVWTRIKIIKFYFFNNNPWAKAIFQNSLVNIDVLY